MARISHNHVIKYFDFEQLPGADKVTSDFDNPLLTAAARRLFRIRHKRGYTGFRFMPHVSVDGGTNPYRQLKVSTFSSCVVRPNRSPV
jgi:hypothetical protein